MNTRAASRVLIIFFALSIIFFSTAGISQSVGAAQSSGGSASSSNYGMTGSFGSGSAGEASGSNYKVFVGPQYFLSTEDEAAGQTQITATQTTTQTSVSGIEIKSIENYPAQPAIGETVQFVADVVSNQVLASATLEIKGENVSTIVLTRTSQKAEFSLVPNGSAGDEFSWKVYAKDSAGKEAVSQSKSFILLSQPPASRECAEAGKPKIIEGPCINGKKKSADLICNATIGRWNSEPKEITCLQNILPGLPASPLVGFLIIGAIIIIFAGVFFYFKKNPELVKKFMERLKERFGSNAKEEKPEQKEKKPELPQEKPKPKIFVKSLKVPKKEKKPPV